MADEAVLTNISEMIDLAIGTPEVGVVDFSMLQTVLHCLAQQLRVLGKNVELRGSVAVLPVGRPAENAPTIAVSEFIVDTGAPGGFSLATSPPTADQESILVVERSRRDVASQARAAQDMQRGQTAPGGKPAGGHGVGPKESVYGTGTKDSGGGGGRGGGAPAKGGGYDAPGGQQQAPPSGPRAPPATPPSAPPGSMGPGQMGPGAMAPTSMGPQGPRPMTTAGTGPSDKPSLVTISKFNLLEGTVQDLRNRVYGTMPKNEDLLQEVRSQGNLKAITDMWTNLNVSSRLEAAEEGIGKLSSLIQDLIGETVELQKATGSPPSAATARMAQEAKAVTEAALSPRAPPMGPPPPGFYQGPGGQMQGGFVQGPGGQMQGPGGQMQGPGGQMQGGFVQGPGGQMQGPGGQMQGPGGQMQGGFVQGPGGQMQGPGGQMQGPGGQMQGPGGQMQGPGGQMQGPGGQMQGGFVQGPGGQMQGPGGQMQGPGGQMQGPGGQMQGPGGQMQGPGGQMQGGFAQGPGGQMQGPGGQMQGPGGQMQGPGGQMQGPGGQMQGGFAQGPGGQMQGPGGQMQGPGGQGGYAPTGQGQQIMYGSGPVDLSWVASKQELMQLLGHLQKLRNDVDILTETFYTSMKEVNENFEPPATLPPPSKVQPTMEVVGGGKDAQGGGKPGGVTTVTQYIPLQMAPMQASLPGNVLERLTDVEKQLKKCYDSIFKSDGLVNDQLNSFQDQLEYMSKQIAGMNMDMGPGKLSPDLVKDLQGLMQLFQTVQEMQAQLQQVNETALQLAAEKEDRQNHIDALLEQIELLKTIKLDREDMVEALADKADLRMLARKVSHDQFEMACDDLSKGLEHALGKLHVQESLWQQALDDIQREIETKLDKMELSPVKEFFNNKLKQLQENLKQMAALRREAEAAGTKRRLLRDVNCISCDAKAVMAMDPPTPMPPKPLPATLSMKPYLSYELDAIRKSQASSLPQRNMHDWEHIDKQMQPNKPHKVRSETDKHLCNRYCGGSHTVTTPAQRVARLGHFIKQWGPEVLPLSSGFAAGDDGRLYKVSTVEGANVGPGGAVEGATAAPKSPVKKAEAPKGPKPIIISAECRCLDPAERPSKN